MNLAPPGTTVETDIQVSPSKQQPLLSPCLLT